MKETSNIMWPEIATSLDANGFAHIPSMLSGAEADLIRGLYRNEELFRATINMQRYRFGRGEYKYFNLSARIRLNYVAKRTNFTS